MSARLVHLVDQLSAVAGTLQPHGSMTVTLSREDMTELLDAAEERDALAAAVERVRALHQACTCCGDDPSCEACDSMAYPCATIRALDAGEANHE